MILIDIIFTLGLTLGLGSSTFALIFFIQALRDGTMDPSERAFLHTVVAVLRIGMILLAAGLAGFFLMDAIGEPMAYGYQCALLFIIALNALLMDKRIMPMRYGPILAGGSWYSLLLATKLPLADVPVWMPVLGYVIFLIVFYFAFHAIKDAVALPKPQV